MISTIDKRYKLPGCITSLNYYTCVSTYRTKTFGKIIKKFYKIKFVYFLNGLVILSSDYTYQYFFTKCDYPSDRFYILKCLKDKNHNFFLEFIFRTKETFSKFQEIVRTANVKFVIHTTFCRVPVPDVH